MHFELANYGFDGQEVIIPDDTITIDNYGYCKLFSLWSGMSYEELIHKLDTKRKIETKYIPIELSVSKTIPLPHFYLSWLVPNGVLCNTYSDGSIMFLTEKHYMFCTLNEARDNYEAYVEDIDKSLGELTEEEKRLISDMCICLLDVWYGIQILMLNPACQTIFSNPIKEKHYSRQGKGKDRKRVVKYIRKHYITPEGIDEALYGHGHRDFERKTMAWYVIGHWRQYKNGTRKFINGYWKGPLREVKCNLDGGRIRELAI